MEDFKEKHMVFTHEDRKLEAIFVHQPEADERRAKELSDFFDMMQGAFQKFVETSDYFADELENHEEK